MHTIIQILIRRKARKASASISTPWDNCRYADIRR